MTLPYALSEIFMIVFFFLFALGALGWVAVSPILLGIVALLVAITKLLRQ